jgi:putative sigma-54 modulation protein
MDLTIKSRNGKISERQRQHIDEKIGRLQRYLGDNVSSAVAVVEVTTEQRRNEGEVHRVQVTLTGDHGVILRAEERAGDLYAAVDEVQDILQRQIKRHKDKHWQRNRQRRQSEKLLDADALATVEPTVSGDEEPEMPGQLVRTKEFRLRPMLTDEAIEQMELLGHSFFVFRDADTSRVGVVYRRKDGDYGLIVPE